MFIIHHYVLFVGQPTVHQGKFDLIVDLDLKRGAGFNCLVSHCIHVKSKLTGSSQAQEFQVLDTL